MVEVDNLEICLGITLVSFIMVEVSNLLEKITDLMTIIVRVVELMAGCFD